VGEVRTSHERAEGQAESDASKYPPKRRFTIFLRKQVDQPVDSEPRPEGAVSALEPNPPVEDLGHHLLRS
jgi:hypothetical protein